MVQFPEELYDQEGFAYFPNMDEHLDDLAKSAEQEDWSYHNTESEHPYPVLFNYIRHTYRRAAQQEKICVSKDKQFACFNTGLVTSHQEPLYASFQVNRIENRQPWYFKAWLREGESQVGAFSQLPEMASYFEEPSDLVFDTRKDFRLNTHHLIGDDDTRGRFPEQYKSLDDHLLLQLLEGAIVFAKKRVRRSYKTAIPQFFNGRVQLLLPLCLADPQQADLALVVDIQPDFYRATTCLTLAMAYSNARLLAKPDRDWLQP